MIERKYTYKLYIALLLCFLQVAGIDMYAQTPADSLVLDMVSADSLLIEIPTAVADTVVADSVDIVNRENLARLDSITNPELNLLSADSIVAVPEVPKDVWVPNPTRATWLAVVFPGAGQIYNRKYWKLPIVYGGFAGCAYALSWNNKMFRDYSQAYVDIMDKDPSTNSYYNFIRGVEINEETDNRYGPILKRKKDYYRRYRDISVFAFIGVYLLSIVDAYVDAELSNFDISPDLSMRVEPAVINSKSSSYFGGKNSHAVGLQCSFTF